jgi:signal transduction histidine kinase
LPGVGVVDFSLEDGKEWMVRCHRPGERSLRQPIGWCSELEKSADRLMRSVVVRDSVRCVPLRVARLRRVGVNPVFVDWALAAAVTVATQLGIWVGSDAAHHRPAAAALAAAITVPVAVRRMFPLWVGAAVPSVSAVDHALWNASSIGYPLATFLALYALAVWTRRGPFMFGTILVVATDFVAAAATGGSMSGTVPFVIVVVVVMLLVRRVVGDRERRADMAERERDVAAREAVMEERSRIARELHDVIAHNVSMMVIQAGAERRDLEGTGSVTRDVLEAIERTGRAALTEMRRLVGMLRSDDSDLLAPQPKLIDLPTLAVQVRAAGLPVELDIQGEQRDLPAGIELAAYRIIQEALTNAMKHADGATASVHLCYRADTLELEITDTGVDAAGAASGGGHGLVGMRERVALYGGRFDASRRPGGGFAIRVLLPVR